MAVAFQILALSHGRHCYKALVIDSPVTRSNRSRGLFSFWALWWGTTRPYYLWIYLGFSMFGIFMWFNRLVAVKTVLNCIMRYQNIIERIIWDHWRLNCLCYTVCVILYDSYWNTQWWRILTQYAQGQYMTEIQVRL